MRESEMEDEREKKKEGEERELERERESGSCDEGLLPWQLAEQGSDIYVLFPMREGGRAIGRWRRREKETGRVTGAG